MRKVLLKGKPKSHLTRVNKLVIFMNELKRRNLHLF